MKHDAQRLRSWGMRQLGTWLISIRLWADGRTFNAMKKSKVLPRTLAGAKASWDIESRRINKRVQSVWS